MRYLSVCSGIEAATVAWHPLGWQPAAFSEIESFPCALLKHHYPHVPNLGDMTNYKEWDIGPIDLLVGGTPCQSFSIAGLRKGLDDPRGNLMLTYLAIAAKYRPRWLVWENVPGVLSSNRGRDFGTFLGGLAELRYGFAYRVLDAQYVRVESHARAVPQRRRRVFVVGYLGDWRRAAAVLFERESLCGNPPPSRNAGQTVTSTLSTRTSGGGGLGTDFECAGGLQPVAGTIQNNGKAAASATRQDAHAGLLVPGITHRQIAFGGNNQSGEIDVATARNACASASASGRMDFESETFVVNHIHVAHSLRAEGFDASEDGAGRGTPIVPVVAPCLTSTYGKQPDSSDTNAGPMLVPYTLAIRGRGDSHDLEYRQDGTANAVLTSTGGRSGIGVGAVAFDCKASGQNGFGVGDISSTMRSMSGSMSHANGGGHLAVAFAQNQREEVRMMEVAGALAAEPGAKQQTYLMHEDILAVRRLTPRECERLQGFPDDFTLVPFGRRIRPEKLDQDFIKYQLRGNPKHLMRDDIDRLASDGPRYKALGNSMAVNVMRLIGDRIEMVENLTRGGKTDSKQ